MAQDGDQARGVGAAAAAGPLDADDGRRRAAGGVGALCLGARAGGAARAATRRGGGPATQEARALRLQALGYSYREIQQLTGWTYTKVNRCLAEGKASFLRRARAIEEGSLEAG